jgi:hypothetical protein
VSDEQAIEVEHERWQEGYEAAVDQVRIVGFRINGARARALRGMADTLDATRDEMELRDSTVNVRDSPQ